MNRGQKIGLWIAAAIVGPILIGLIAGIFIVRTDRFRNFVRAKLVTTVEEATGGRVEVGGFSFDWTHLRAIVNDFVIHGLEPADAPPLFRARLLEVDLKLLSPFKGFVDIAYLLADTPQANIIVFTDGHTNIPAPKIKKPSDKSGLETIVDLAIGKFDLRNGSVLFGERKTDFNASGANLRAQLAYNAVNPSYTGQVDLNPLHLKYGPNQPVDVAIQLPVKLEKDRITLANARFSTPESQVVVSGALENLKDPRTSAHVNARIALAEVRRAAGLSIPLDTAHAPDILMADATLSMSDNRIQIQSGRATYGQSSIEASGTLRNDQNPGAVQFNAAIALGEIGRLLRVAAQPEGTVKIGGNATLAANNDYKVTANVDARGLSVRQGSTRLTGINLDSSVSADPHRIELSGLRLNAFGGGFTGSASLVEMAQFRVAGNLHNFDIDQLTRSFMQRSLGYDGVISGPMQAEGDIRNPGDVVARANLGIAPGRRGIPVSGRIHADYNGRADTATLGNSFLQLPHTRVDLSGSLGREIRLHAVSRNFSDFRPLGDIPVTFTNNGAATVDATVTGSLSAPKIVARAAVTNFAVEGRPFDRFVADIGAAKNAVTVANGSLTRGPLQAQLSAAVGLHDWKPLNSDPLRADVTMRNADVADVLAIAGQSSVNATGALTADAHIAGTVGVPRGNIDLAVMNGTIEGERFDALNARALLTQQSIEVPALSLVAGPSRIDATATYQHAPDDLKRGTLRAHLASNQVQLAQFQSLVKDRPGLRGTVSMNGDAAGEMSPAGFQLTAVNANVNARGLEMEGKSLGDLTATATTAGNTVQYDVHSDLAGSTIRVNGRSLLTGNHDTTATAQIANLPIDRVLALAGKRDLPVNGTLSANGQVSGTVQDPRLRATLEIAKGSAYQEPFDRLQATIGYTNQAIDVPNFRVDAAGSYLEASGNYTHPAGNFAEGRAQFHARSNDLQLSRFHTVQQSRPGLGGVVRIAADGAATLRASGPPLFSSLNAEIAARGLSVNKKGLGDLTATAQTRGNEVDFQLTSDLARANIRGSGRMGLTGDYPLTANLNFSNVTYEGLSPLLDTTPQPIDARMDGSLDVSGPLTNADALRGAVRLTRVEAHSAPAPTGRKPRVEFELHNSGPVVIALDRSLVTIQSARITGPFTNLSLSGTASIKDPRTLNVRADGSVNLEILEAFNTDVFSSGTVTLNAAVTGTLSKPAVNGRLQLQNASLNVLSAPNGLSNGNGTITFTGTEAIIQNLSGETGGGKVTLAGFFSYGGPEAQFRITANADKIHVSYPESITTQTSARLTWAGATSRSLVSGRVSIEDVALHSHSDIGSILTSAATPPSAARANTGLLGNVHFDVRIQTAPDVQFRTTLTQNLQADANLTLRGTLDHPGMLGRVVVTQGEVIFFGSKYTIDQGIVSFFNPNRINPILNIDLATTVQGIDVSLSVTGPMDRMKLAYRSDPPMLFSDLVSLLASGKVSTTDPVLAARQPVAPEQNFQQAGASTLLSQAVANPVSGRLQRLFGVSKLKIDPQIIGANNTPQATLTLQQQITRELTFTYIQDVTSSNPQIIRMEWTPNPRWSAVAQRDLNGSFDLDFFYKKRFW